MSYYKAKLNDEIVDALEILQCVRFYPKVKRILRILEKKDVPQGIISTNGQYIWHVEEWEEFPEEVQDSVSGTVTLIEIEEAEYSALRTLLDAGQTPIEPEEEESEPETDEETLAWAKKQKIAISKTSLATYLEQNPIVSTAHGGVEGTYSVTEEKQQLMALNYNTYQIKKAAGVDAVLTWNETGEECEEWTEAEFVQLIIEIEAYVKPLVSKQQAFEKQIQAATTLQEVDAIEIIY